jgi:lipoate-protein ligase A
MAIDHALLDALHNEAAANTLRFYRWSPSAVSIGRFQHIEDEVDLEACKSQNVDIVRRLSSGGAVYHDFEGELTYSIICRTDEAAIPIDVLASYKHLCSGLLKGLRNLGLHAEFSPGSERFCPNLFVSGRKLSGNCQSRRGNALLQHGTVLRLLDLQKMLSVLKTMRTKAASEVLERAAESLTSLQQELGEAPAFERIEESLIAGFSTALGAHFYEEPLTEAELESARGLAKTWYENPSWTFQRGFEQ